MVVVIQTREDTADFLITGKMMAVLKQAGTVIFSLLESEMLQMSVKTSDSLLFLVQGQVCYLDKLVTLSRSFLPSAVLTDGGRSSGGRVDSTAESLWRTSKASIKCLYFNLTHSTHLNTAADQGTGSGTVSL